MPTNYKNVLPKKLISLAKNISPLPVAIVSADQYLVMESAQLAYDLNLIDPIFIGNKIKIINEANSLNWDISKFRIIDMKSIFEHP